MTSTDYERYLRSERWKSFRRYYKDCRKWKCCVCGTNVDLQLHHRTYERLGCEALSDVVPVCQRCHSWIHAEHRRTPKESLWAVTDRVRKACQQGRRDTKTTRKQRKVNKRLTKWKDQPNWLREKLNVGPEVRVVRYTPKRKNKKSVTRADR